jgi:septal ring factor EnvC (AmiA/AmiB activator)
MKVWFFSIFLCCCLAASWGMAQDDGKALQENLLQENRRADQRESQVRKLTEQAGQISTHLSDIEGDIGSLKSKIRAQEVVLKEIRENERKARQDHFDLEKEKQRIAMELSGLMRSLWPVHLQSVRTRFEGVDSWDTFDRRFNWLAVIYEATRGKFEEARANSERIAENLESQRLLEAEAEAQLKRVNGNKDRLLDKKYTLRKTLNTIRKQRNDAEAELSEILASIEDLKYQLQSQKTKQFSLYKRVLPWPVHGRLISGFNPKATPPVRGLVIGTAADAAVQSIFWGKVVHNDTLRGFGHVVIVYHGYDYYSLYAYLSQTYVRNGQEVEKDEPLGVVGYYPKADGPGLYFELRFHQKPINPKVWLTSIN